jgi:hypothetical protein
LFLDQFRSGIEERQRDWDARWAAMGALVKDVWNQIVDGLKSALGSMLDAVSTWVQSVIDKLRSIASAIADAFSSANASGLPAGGGGENPSPFAGGGRVHGPGTSTSDSIWARLSRGEFVIRAAAVEHYGAGLFAALNAMRYPAPRFNLGGLAESLSAALMPAPAFRSGGLALAPAAGGGGRSLTLVIDGQRFGGFTGSEGAVAKLEQYAIASSMRATGRSPSWRK